MFKKTKKNRAGSLSHLLGPRAECFATPAGCRLALAFIWLSRPRFSELDRILRSFEDSQNPILIAEDIPKALKSSGPISSVGRLLVWAHITTGSSASESGRRIIRSCFSILITYTSMLSVKKFGLWSGINGVPILLCFGLVRTVLASIPA